MPLTFNKTGSNTINLDPITYNDRYPGLDEYNYKKLSAKIDALGLTGYEREKAMDEVYQQVLPLVQNDIKNSDRRKYINQAKYEVSQIQDPTEQKQANMKLSTVELTQLVKEKYNVDSSANDEAVLDSWLATVPNGEQLLANYLNNGDKELLYKGGLEEKDGDKNYNMKRQKVTDALRNNWRQLSDDGLKYLRDYNTIFDVVQTARSQGMGEGMSDYELLQDILPRSKELKELQREITSLEQGLSFNDKTILGMNDDVYAKDRHEGINMVRDFFGFNTVNPATQQDILEELYVRGNSDGEIGKNFKANLRNWGDSIEKFAYRTPKDIANKIYEGGIWVDELANKYGLPGASTQEQIDIAREKVNAKRLNDIQNVQLYNESLDKEAKASKDAVGLDPIIQNYYSGKGMVESLFNADLGGFAYKSAGDMAGNRDMLLGIGASIVNPAFGLAVMGTDTFARENQEAFDSLIDAQTKQGVSYQDAYDNATKGAAVVGLVNTTIELGLEKFLGGVETGVANNIRDMFMNDMSQGVTEMIAKRGIMDLLAKGLETQAKSSLEEGLEEVFQQAVQNIAISEYDPDHKISDGLWEAFESGALNPMNLLAGGSEIVNGIDVDAAKESMLNGAYNLGVGTRNLTDSLNNGAYDAGVIVRNITDSLNNGAYNLGETTRNITDKVGITNDGTTSSQGNVNTQGNVAVEGAEMVTPQGTETTVDNTLTEISNKGDKATLKEELYSIDPTLKKNLQNNPYSAEVWQRTKDYIDKNGRPERSNDVAKALIEDVADRVQAKLIEKMDEGGETGKLYKPLKEAGFTVDLTELKDGIDEMLEGFGIEIEDGKLNFDKTAIDGSEASNIRKIYNWLQTTNAPMNITEYLERFRRTLTDMVDFNQNGRDQAGRKVADTPGDKVLKKIRTEANDLAHKQISELAELDKEFNEWVKVMDEVSDGLVYKDSSKRGIIRDNITQIIKNLDEPTRRQLANRLEKIMPGIREEVNAINQMPKVIDHYYNPSKLQQGLTSEGLKAFGSLGGLPGYLLTRWGGAKISEKIDSFKSKAWDEVLQETSEEGKAKMREIQAKIEENKRLTKEQEARLQGLKDRLMEKMATVEKTDAEQSAWESYLADLEQDEVIDMPEEVYDQWEEVTTTPKEKITKKKTTKKKTTKKKTSKKS